MSGLPLEGLLVVAVEQAVAAPFATRQLADLGARVIKIERPGVGDFARAYDSTVKGMSSHFVWLNRTKQSLTLDLKRPEAIEVLRGLLSRADVFIHNLAPGAVARLGFGSDTVRREYPRAIVCEISGYGSSGPYRDKKAYDLLVQSRSYAFLSRYGPDEPYPEISQTIARGYSRRTVSDPNPRRATAPGARLWMKTSARDRSPRRTSIASGRFKSSVSDCLVRLSHTKWLDIPFTVESYARAKSPTPGRSILMTRAPRSASCRVANGAATACSTATTSVPSSGRPPASAWP